MKQGFVREVYLRSVPSVDLQAIEGKVDCTKHTIRMSVYDKILLEFSETDDDQFAANMFMLMNGPQLVEG